jgi:hypothetical protein
MQTLSLDLCHYLLDFVAAWMNGLNNTLTDLIDWYGQAEDSDMFSTW